MHSSCPWATMVQHEEHAEEERSGVKNTKAVGVGSKRMSGKWYEGREDKILSDSCTGFQDRLEFSALIFFPHLPIVLIRIHSKKAAGHISK